MLTHPLAVHGRWAAVRCMGRSAGWLPDGALGALQHLDLSDNPRMGGTLPELGTAEAALEMQTLLLNGSSFTGERCMRGDTHLPGMLGAPCSAASVLHAGLDPPALLVPPTPQVLATAVAVGHRFC